MSVYEPSIVVKEKGRVMSLWLGPPRWKADPDELPEDPSHRAVLMFEYEMCRVQADVSDEDKL